MKIPKITISNKAKYTIVSILEGSLLLGMVVGLFVLTNTREPEIIKTTGSISKLELALDEPPSAYYVRVSLRSSNLSPFVTNLKVGETLHLNHQYVFFTKNNVILYHTDSK
jgi:hypothetical protein